jgi:hypothetical protein
MVIVVSPEESKAERPMVVSDGALPKVTVFRLGVEEKA